jgi:hypothetical protein
MAENPGEPAGDHDHEKAQPDAAKPHEGEVMSNNLPMVVAPKLGAGEDESTDEIHIEEPGAEAEESAAPPPAASAPTHSSRFMILAASVAFAAAFGSFVGSVSGSGLAHVLYPPSAMPAASSDGVNEAVRTMNLEIAEIKTIKANFDAATRGASTQIAKIADRLDHIDQRVASAAAGAPPAEVTGSVAGAPTADSAKLSDRVLQDWIVQDVQNGRALVESRYGAIFDVGAGSTLPGVGRVETVKRQDGQWVVVTARGLITSGR